MSVWFDNSAQRFLTSLAMHLAEGLGLHGYIRRPPACYKPANGGSRKGILVVVNECDRSNAAEMFEKYANKYQQAIEGLLDGVDAVTDRRGCHIWLPSDVKWLREPSNAEMAQMVLRTLN